SKLDGVTIGGRGLGQSPLSLQGQAEPAPRLGVVRCELERLAVRRRRLRIPRLLVESVPEIPPGRRRRDLPRQGVAMDHIGVRDLALTAQHGRKVRDRRRILRVHAERLAERGLRVGVASLTSKRQPEAHVRLGEVGPQPDRFAKRRGHLGIARLLEQRSAELHVGRDPVGLEEDRLLEDRLGLGRAPLTAQDQAEPEIRLQATGIKLDGLTVRRFGLVVPALHRPTVSAIAQGLGISHRVTSLQSGRTATASISTSRSSLTRREISTSVLAGRWGPKYSLRATLTFSRSAMFLRKTVTLHTSANVAPAAARQRFKFSWTWRAWAVASLPPTVRPASSEAAHPGHNNA